jgi:gas vesicle protein
MGNNDNDSGASKLAFLLIGGGIGAILALLFAPKSGKELRGDIADATRKGIDYTREQGKLVGDLAGDYYERGRGRANELVDQGRERVSSLMEHGRDAVTTKRDAVTAAIEAGKQAYQDTKRKARAADDSSENEA